MSKLDINQVNEIDQIGRINNSHDDEHGQVSENQPNELQGELHDLNHIHANLPNFQGQFPQVFHGEDQQQQQHDHNPQMAWNNQYMQPNVLNGRSLPSQGAPYNYPMGYPFPQQPNVNGYPVSGPYRLKTDAVGQGFYHENLGVNIGVGYVVAEFLLSFSLPVVRTVPSKDLVDVVANSRRNQALSTDTTSRNNVDETRSTTTSKYVLFHCYF
jgi:hypothetical protein